MGNNLEELKSKYDLAVSAYRSELQRLQALDRPFKEGEADLLEQLQAEKAQARVKIINAK